MTDTIPLVAYCLLVDHQTGCHLDARSHPALGHSVVFCSVDDAEDAISRIFEIERRRIEASLAARQPHPAAAKKAWDDKIGACALIEERIADWRVHWDREKQAGYSRLSCARVQIGIEQRTAWREVRQVTRTTEAGLEVVHELGEPGPWSEWYAPIGGSSTYLPHLEISVVPDTWQMAAGPREIRAWLKGQLVGGVK